MKSLKSKLISDGMQFKYDRFDISMYRFDNCVTEYNWYRNMMLFFLTRPLVFTFYPYGLEFHDIFINGIYFI